MDRQRVRATIVAVAIVASGCGSLGPAPTGEPGSPSQPAATSGSTSAPPASLPAPEASGPAPSPDPAFEAVVAEAIEFRRSMGLRADEAWAREVALDPGALRNHGVPLTVSEEAELDRRAAILHELRPILQQYAAAQPEEFAGLFVDQQAGGSLVVLVTGRPVEHEAAIARLVPPGAPVEVRLVPTSERDLEALMERIGRDAGGLRGLGIVVLETSIDTEENRVEVGVSTQRTDADAVITWRYGPNVSVRFIDPTGAYLKPPGTVVGRVVDARGRGVEANAGLTPLFAELPLDAVGYQTNPDGTFRFERVVPGRWRFTAVSDAGEASTDVEVRPGETATLEVILPD